MKHIAVEKSVYKVTDKIFEEFINLEMDGYENLSFDDKKKWRGLLKVITSQSSVMYLDYVFS